MELFRSPCAVMIGGCATPVPRCVLYVLKHTTTTEEIRVCVPNAVGGMDTYRRGVSARDGRPVAAAAAGRR